MNKHKHNTLNRTINKPPIPELNHHSPQSRRSGALAQVLPASQRRWNSSSQTAGFTIIEVVLVLAIAGLIFLMVFVALPALQRSRRDTQRKNDVARLGSAIERYKANNKGKVPSSDNSGIELRTAKFRSYLVSGGDSFKDPDGTGYYIDSEDPSSSNAKRVTHCNPGGVRESCIFYNTGYKCGIDGNIETANGNNRYTLRKVLEGGGVHCLDG
ncbi:type II secretion system protein [Candidatus Saccharibacteria bacterium]|nr:type II secretion system protein [Candidatus Saccharibacteria bacterium]